MKKIIELKNVNFKYNKDKKFTDLCLEIYEGDIVSLIGPSGSGKTTILKILCHLLPNDNMYFMEKNIKNCDIKDVKRNVIVVLDSPLKKKTIIEELIQYLDVCSITDMEKKEKARQFIKYFGLEDIQDKPINQLSANQKNMIKILRYLIIEPSFIAIDGLFSSLDRTTKDKFINFIKENKITFLNITNDLNDTLYGNKIFLIDNFTLILEGATNTVLKTDTMLKKLGFDLPDEVELSIELINYGILNKIYTDKEKMVNTLWK